MSLDEQIKKLIQQRIEKLECHSGKRYASQHPLYPKQKKRIDLQEVQEKIKKLEAIHVQIKERVKRLKDLIPDITEQTTLCAVYLTFGKVLQTWESIFLLASRGHDFDMMGLVRSIGENLDLIKTFYLDKEQKHLKRWFHGEIIEHSVSRRLGDGFIRGSGIKAIDESELSPYDMATDVYKALSKYTHCSYAALLDSVDVFNEDFDWNRYAGAHYTLHNFHSLESAMTGTLLILKMIYGERGDMVNYNEANKILVDFAGPLDEESLKDLIPKIKNRG